MATYNASDWVEVTPEEPAKVVTPPRGTILKASEWVEVKPAPIITPPEPKRAAIPNEPISTSAKRDVMAGLSGLAQLGKSIAMVASPSDQNTLAKIYRAAEASYNKGELAEDTFGIIKDMVVTPLANIKRAVEPIMEKGVSGISESAEIVAREPFSYTMDFASLVPFAKGAGAASKLGASVVFGPKTSSISARILKSPAIRNARPPEAIAMELPEAFTSLDKKIKDASNAALDTLSDDAAKGYPLKEIIDTIAETKAKVIGNVVTASDEQAVRALERIEKNLTKIYGAEVKDTGLLTSKGKPVKVKVSEAKNISQKELKGIIQKLDKDIDWDTPLSEVSNKALQDLRHSVDVVLKADNPAYAESMRPLANLVGLKTSAQDVLKVDSLRGKYIVDGSTTKAVNSIHKGPVKVNELKILEDFSKETGLNIPEEVRNHMIRMDFDNPNIRGARRAAAGGFMGGMVAGAEGAGVGAAAGTAIDVIGGKILGGAIDTAAPVLKGVSRAIEAAPKAAMAAPVFSQAARDIKAQYKAGKITKEEAAKMLRDSGEFK